MTDWLLQAALHSLFFFSKSFFTASCPQLSSQPSQILAQYFNLDYIMCSIYDFC